MPTQLGQLTLLRKFCNAMWIVVVCTAEPLTLLSSPTPTETLKLRRNSLDGAIITELGNLVELDRLNLGRNQLTGSVPAEIGNLVALRVLRLDHNDLDSEIPREIGNLVGLTDLSLNNNLFTGRIPNDLEDLDRLEVSACNRIILTWPRFLGSNVLPFLSCPCVDSDHWKQRLDWRLST